MGDKDPKTGRFLPGNQWIGKAPGRPKRKVEERILTELASRLDQNDQLAKMLDALVAGAAEGHLEQTRFIFEYMVGKPVVRTEQRIQLEDLLQAWSAGDEDTGQWESGAT